MIDLVKAITNIENVQDLHAVRLLILIQAFSGADGSDQIDGLTKLAKLDFLLRYPVLLERALIAKNRPLAHVELQDHERYSVEARMVRYRFGPWDHMYREVLNALIARDLVDVSVIGRKMVIALTPKGVTLARGLSNVPEFEAYARRSKILRRHFDLTATNLMKFIYDTFPEIISLRSNTEIIT